MLQMFIPDANGWGLSYYNKTVSIVYLWQLHLS